MAKDPSLIPTPRDVPDNTEDESTRKARQELDQAGVAARLRRQRLKNQSLAQNIRERKRYADRVFNLVCAWSGVLGLILISTGTAAASHQVYVLSDAVLIALVSGTTVNVLGLLLIVVNYLFPKPRRRRN